MNQIGQYESSRVLDSFHYEYLPTDVVDDLSQLKVVEHFNVVSRLCAKLIALLIAEHVRVGGCGRHQSSLRQVHLDQILYL